jgi:hypothetical protein
LFLTCLSLLLTGCTLTSGTLPPSPTSAHLSIKGAVFGGQQPISQSHLYLLAANTTGYGGNGILPSALNASVSLLNPGPNTVQDANGNYYYVTDSNGNFSITGDYTPCGSGTTTQVYLYAVGGNPGASSNSAIGLMAALGTCANIGPSTTVFMDEATTVAAAYALAGFATDAMHISSSGTALAQIGVANAFTNAANLVNLTTGVANSATSSGNASVPISAINTLANILAACNNTFDTVSNTGTITHSSACSTLLTTATSDGTSTGAQPTDAATAAINIAHNPGSNISTLYPLASTTPPFQPALTSQPNDFILSLDISGLSQGTVAIDDSGNAWIILPGFNQTLGVSKVSNTGATLATIRVYDPNSGGLTTPDTLAIDSADNVWIANTPNGPSVSSIVKLSSAGLPDTGSPFTGNGLYGPSAISIDASGSAWITNVVNETVSEFSNSGADISGSPFTPPLADQLNNPGAMAFDGSGNLFVVNQGATGAPFSPYVSILSNNGTGLGAYFNLGGPIYYGPQKIAVDSSGALWMITNQTADVYKISNTGLPASGFPISGFGIGAPYGVAIDGSGQAWVAHGNGITNISNSGTVISAKPYTGGQPIDSAELPSGIAIDGSGDVWISWSDASNGPFGRLVEFIGAATPVITPLCAGLPATPTTDGSSNLGTRP